MSPAWFAPQDRDAGLAQHAHRFEMEDRLKGLEWPDLCPACGAPARERLTVHKVFIRRRGRRGRTRSRRAPVSDPGGLLAWGVVGFFAVICVGSVLAMMSETRPFRVRPQTEVTRAFDFSDELGNVLQGRRRVYTIQNAAFAQRFASANRTGS